MTQTKTRTRTAYVCGFLFAPGWQQVALVKKAKPEWQAGKYNGVGGKIEVVYTTTEANQKWITKRPETPLEAMTREFQEEAGVLIAGWDHFVTVLDAAHGGYAVYFFRATTERLWDFRKDETEQVVWIDLDRFTELPVVTNLSWLIPLALDPNVGDDRITNEPPG